MQRTTTYIRYQLVRKLLQYAQQLVAQWRGKSELAILKFREADLKDSYEIRTQGLFVMSLVERQ